ncbi:MAG: hypothetical protein Q7K43_04885 [Candidatus Woesearchaeota archaeon]|nr:hypothetical protein [Candidatus Woesearchaeota archaeon]
MEVTKNWGMKGLGILKSAEIQKINTKKIILQKILPEKISKQTILQKINADKSQY